MEVPKIRKTRTVCMQQDRGCCHTTIIPFLHPSSIMILLTYISGFNTQAKNIKVIACTTSHISP